MSGKAKLFISVLCVVAMAVLAVAAVGWNPANLQRFLLFFALAMLASAMKIRLPGFKTTISPNFVFVLVGIAMFSFGETVLVGLGGALVQTFWKAQSRPKPVQVVFNAACLTVCTASAFWTAHGILGLLGFSSLPALMVLGAGVYVVLNTGLVSLVISLAEQRPLRELWSSCYEWTFPYFLVGSGVAGLASFAARSTTWGAALLVLPAMYFVYVYLPPAHLPRGPRNPLKREPRRRSRPRGLFPKPLIALRHSMRAQNKSQDPLSRRTKTQLLCVLREITCASNRRHRLPAG